MTTRTDALPRAPCDGCGSRRRAVIAVLTGAALCSGPRETRGAESAPTPGCTKGEQGALTELACDLASNLRLPADSAPGSVVVASTLPTAGRAVARGVELSARFAAETAHALGPAARALPGAVTLAEAESAARGARLLVVIGIEVAGGKVRAAADTHPAPRGFWDRVRGLAEESGVHALASRRVDGEIAPFLPPVPLVVTRIDKAAGPADVVALACGELNDDALEIAVVGRHKIQAGSVRGGRFAPRAETTWATLAPVASSPLREPIAHAEITGSRLLVVGSTDRDGSWFLSSTLAPVRRWDASVPWHGGGSGVCLSRVGTALGNPTACDHGGKPAMDVGDVPAADAIASGTAVSAAGTARTVVAWRAPSDGTVTLRDGAGRVLHIPNLGGALAIGDLDSDGTPELLASESTPNAAEDALVVRSWGDDGTARERLRVPVPEGIRAIAACPRDDSTMAAIVVATPSSLWVVR